MRTLNLLSKWSFQSFSIFFSGSAILRRRRNLFRSIFQWRFSSRKVRSKSKELACFTSTIFLHNKLQAISPQFRTVNFPVSPRYCCSHFFTPSNPGVECTFEVVSTAPQSGDVWLRTTFVSGQGLVCSVFLCVRGIYLWMNNWLRPLLHQSSRGRPKQACFFCWPGTVRTLRCLISVVVVSITILDDNNHRYSRMMMMMMIIQNISWPGREREVFTTWKITFFGLLLYFDCSKSPSLFAIRLSVLIYYDSTILITW